MFRRVLRILSAKKGAMVGAALVLLPLGAFLSFCGIGLPIVARALKSLAHLTLAGACAVHGQPAPPDPAKSWAGTIGTLHVGAVAGGATLVAMVTADHLGAVAPLVGVVLVVLAGSASYVVLGAVFAPLLFAPICSASGPQSPGLFSPLARSLVLAAQHGPRANAAFGARIGAIAGAVNIALGGFYWAVAGGGPRPDMVPGWVFIAAVLSVPFVYAALADRFVVLGGSEATSASAPPVDSRLRGLAWLIVPALGVLGLAFLWAAFVPSPMRHSPLHPDPRRGMDGVQPTTDPQSARLPGTSVTVRTTARGVAVEADDGGGAGELDARLPTAERALYVARRTLDGEPQPSFLVAVTDGETWALADVDTDGVRLDDSLSARTLGRLGPFGSGALGLSLLLLLYLSFTVGSELGAARSLSAPALLGSRDPSARRGSLKALEGTLRVGEGSRVVFRPASFVARVTGHRTGDLRAEGEAWIEADDGQLRFRFSDRPIAVLGGRRGEDWDGRQVVVLSRFTKSGAVGLRESSASFPEDGRITLGARADATELLVAGAVRRASLLVAPILAGFAVVMSTLLLQL